MVRGLGREFRVAARGADEEGLTVPVGGVLRDGAEGGAAGGDGGGVGGDALAVGEAGHRTDGGEGGEGGVEGGGGGEEIGWREGFGVWGRWVLRVGVEGDGEEQEAG